MTSVTPSPSDASEFAPQHLAAAFKGHGAAYRNHNPNQPTTARDLEIINEIRARWAQPQPLDTNTRVQAGDLDYDVRVHEVRPGAYRLEVTSGGILVRYDTRNGEATFDRSYATEDAATSMQTTVIAWLHAGLTPTAVASLTIDA